MGEVTITLNERTYRFACGDGEEARLLEVADVLRAKVNQLLAEHGHIGAERLLVMAGLMVADDLLDLQAGGGQTEPASQGKKAPA